ncbi:MAG: replicative DNA helicase [Oricola sp.]
MNAQSEIIRADNIEAEQAVLGTVLAYSGAYDEVARILEPEHFAEPLHEMIFRVIGERTRAGRPVDPVSILPFIPSKDDLGDITVKEYVDRLWQRAALPVEMARGAATSVYEMWLRRRAYTECEDFIRALADLPADRDILDEVGRLEEKLAEIRARRFRGGDRSAAGTRYLDNMQAAYQRKEIVGVPIFMREIADVISEPCFEAGNLYGLLSSSGEGKTSLTMQIVYHALDHGHPVQFLSFDQSEEQCIRQMVAQVHGISTSRQRRGDLSEKEWFDAQKFAEWMNDAPVEFIDLTDETAARIKTLTGPFLRRHHNRKTPLIVVDHIGRVTPLDQRANEGTKAAQINAVFKGAAKETGAAWLVLNQRNTFGMKRDNPRPIASDLYGGEQARQSYDAVFYLYRYLKHYEERAAVAATDADWKKIVKVFPEAVRKDHEDLAELGAIKVRFGSTAVRRTVEFDAPLTRYRPLKEEQEPEEELPL